ncbi:MAG: zinc-dependent metalloprotease, partial [Acidimicrobiales bacterium]
RDVRRPVSDEEAAGAPLVDWAFADRVARWAAGRTAVPTAYRPAAMQRDFDEMTERAERLVAEATGLSPGTPARGRVIDRPAWVSANISSFQRLLGPTLSRLAERKPNSPLASMPPVIGRRLAGMSRSLNGTELALVLAWMSTRVLGQYDLFLADGVDEEHQDIVYFVGPNVAGIEARHGFDPTEFRLWLALHEVTHRAQFMAVPWLRSYFVSQVEQGLEPIGSDPRKLIDAVWRAAQEIRAGRSPLGDVGVVGLIATDEQLVALKRIQALMSLLEGHGDVTMDRAGADAVPGAERFSAVLKERREQAKGPARLLQQVLGLEAKFRQYAEGERFVRSVEEAGGRRLFDRVWQGPEWLPSLAEIRDPATWVRRVSPNALAG